MCEDDFELLDKKALSTKKVMQQKVNNHNKLFFQYKKVDD